jgi:hypothetical protein
MGQAIAKHPKTDKSTVSAWAALTDLIARARAKGALLEVEIISTAETQDLAKKQPKN